MWPSSVSFPPWWLDNVECSIVRTRPKDHRWGTRCRERGWHQDRGSGNASSYRPAGPWGIRVARGYPRSVGLMQTDDYVRTDVSQYQAPKTFKCGWVRLVIWGLSSACIPSRFSCAWFHLPINFVYLLLRPGLQLCKVHSPIEWTNDVEVSHFVRPRICWWRSTITHG